jgi:hypothetical protein
MACYIVIFEIDDPDRLTAFKESLKLFPRYCPLTNQAWAIVTDKKETEVRDQLAASMLQNDRLYVFRSGTAGAWRNAYSEKHSEWLKTNL